jgi:alpha-amylase
MVRWNVSGNVEMWKCEHRYLYMPGGVDFRNNTTNHFATSDWKDNGANQITFGRGSQGFVAIN